MMSILGPNSPALLVEEDVLFSRPSKLLGAFASTSKQLAVVSAEAFRAALGLGFRV